MAVTSGIFFVRQRLLNLRDFHIFCFLGFLIAMFILFYSCFRLKIVGVSVYVAEIDMRRSADRVSRKEYETFCRVHALNSLLSS